MQATAFFSARHVTSLSITPGNTKLTNIWSLPAHIRKAQNATGKQQTLKTAFRSKTSPQVEKVKICQAWIKVFCAANIPLHKPDNEELQNFHQTKVTNGGAIPKSPELRDYYLFDMYEVEKS